MARQWWLGVVFFLALTLALLARPGTVKTKDGRTIDGEIDDTPGADSLTVTIHGVKIAVPRDNVDSVTYSANFEQQYKDRLGKLAPTDAKGRVELSRWAFDNRQYELARQAADAALKIDPNNADAAALLETVKATIAMENRRPAPTAPPAGEENTGHTAPPAGQAAAPTVSHFLSADDINTIRQTELQSDDANVKVQFLNKVKERYLSSGDKDAVKFNALPLGTQAMTILATGDANLIKDVKIMGDPASLVEYRTKIQPRLLVGCAASGCHGGVNAGSFYLYTNADTTAAWYTNFYILQKYTTKVSNGAGFGGGEVLRSTIDRTQPSTSLLIQYGLPMNIANSPHPKAPGFKPMFLTDQDPTAKEIIHWMGTSLKPFASEYQIKFELPTGKSSTQPSTTQPAAAP